MKKITSSISTSTSAPIPRVAPAPPSASASKARPSPTIGAKTLITLSSIVITMSGWAYLSLDAATKDLATKQAQTQSDMQDVASVTSIGSAVAASEVLLNPLPTLAPLARPKVSGVTQNIQPVTQPAVAAPAAAAPAVAAAPAALPKPRKIHVRAVTRASR